MKLTLQQRRRITCLKQFEGLTHKQIMARGFTDCQVNRWQNVDATGSDALFTDTTRCGRPPKLTAALKRRIMKRLEWDDAACVANAAAQFGVSESTVRRVGNELGGQVSRHKEVYISAVHREAEGLCGGPARRRPLQNVLGGPHGGYDPM